MAQLEGSATRRRAGRSVALALIGAALLAWAPGAHAETRYSLAGGCFTLTSSPSGQAAPGAGNLRMQPTRLGSYLLYGPAGDYISGTGGNAVGHAPQPSPAADWQIDDAGSGAFTLSPASDHGKLLAVNGGNLVLVQRQGAGNEAHFSFSASGGCADFPDAELDATGTPAHGSTPYGEVKGFIDGHMHWMTFEYLGGNFHCGQPWHPYGIPYALPDCSGVEGPLGATGTFQNFLNYGSPVFPHDTTGWPKMAETGAHNLTSEGTYWRWMQRVWMDGLRLIVMPINENRMLCQLQANRKTDCDEMETVYRGLDDVYALQDYIDALSGGPGKGFMRIVTDPFQARKVINEGKMAVVLEVEVSEPFGCTNIDAPTCNQAGVDAGLQKLYDRGVRSSLLLNKFDNPLTGVRFDSGAFGALINAGNKISAGSFFSAKTCGGGAPHDNEIDYLTPQAGFIGQTVNDLGVPPGTLPTYPAGPHCNTRGLTGLGAHVVNSMMDKGMIVNPDHMSQLAVGETIDIAEKRHYSGLISPHGWMDPKNWPRIYNLGGMAFPDSNNAQQFVDDWRKYRPANSPYFLGWGYGADLGGLAQQPDPSPGGAVDYPFKSLDGSVTFNRQRTGDRTFDYNAEGVAHYGLYADWMEQVRKLGGPALTADMLRGAESYLEMWERSDGVSSGRCLPEKLRFTGRGLGNLKLAYGAEDLLKTAGQPLSRTQAWTYCVAGKHNAKRAATAILTPQGTVAVVVSNARGHKAKGIGAGAKLSRLRGLARRTPGNIWIRKLGKKRIGYVVRHRRVKLVAVAARSVRGRKTLRRYLSLVALNSHKKKPKRREVPVSKSDRHLTDADALPLRMQRAAAQISFVCGLTLSHAPPPANPFAPPL